MIEKYLESKQLAWAPSTLKSETTRLKAASANITGDPMVLWKSLQQHGAYGRTTIWTRVTDFYQWCLDNDLVAGKNPYKQFRETNERQFKNVYNRKTPEITFEEARALIAQLPNSAHRERANALLNSGMRYSESGNVQSGGTVVGKGGKQRTVYLPDGDVVNNDIQYRSFLRSLQKVGLKPHDLRKLFATRLVELGASEFELTEVMGWSSIATASSYVKANDDKIKKLVQMVQGVNDVSEKQVS